MDPLTSIHRAAASLALLLATLAAAQPQPPQPAASPAQPSPQPTEDPSAAQAQTLNPAWVSTLKWRSIGPANMGGRITDFAVCPSDPTTYWVATAGAGLLKTANNGTTFDFQLESAGSSSVGAVAVAPSDPGIVWVGTGEANPRNSVSWGDGVYKSTDGGKTFTHMGLKDSFQISRIVIHPTNPDIVYIGAMGRCWGPGGERGLYRTADGGKSFERILQTDDNTGIIDIAMSPADPDLILAAAWERQRDGFDTNDPIKKWGPGSGLYKATDGKTFAKVTKGLPTNELGRIGLDFYRKDPSHIYAVVDCAKIGMAPANATYAGLTGENADAGARLTRVVDRAPAAEAGLKVGDIILSVNGKQVLTYDALLAAFREHKPDDVLKIGYARDRAPAEAELKLAKRPGNGTDRPYTFALGGQAANIQDQQGPDGFEHGGVYKSTDYGDSWTRINSLNPRPMYFSQVRVDPTDEQYIYILGVALHISKDGGKTFTDDAARTVHADHHAMWINPANSRHMLLGCDGGVYATFDRGQSWDHLNHAAIGQFYSVAIDSRPFYNVYGGLQDNGSWGGPSRTRTSTGAVNEDWFRIGSGDGFVCAVDPDDPDQLYYESQNGGTAWRNLRTGAGGSVRPTAPAGMTYRFNWRTPFILSHHNPKIYYNAGNYVFRTFAAGKSTIKRISPEISRTDRGTATALAESPLDPDILYAGTDDGALWMTRDGGHTWHDLFKPIPADLATRGSAPEVGPARGGMLARLDTNGDGKIERSEAENMGRFFDQADTDGNGIIEGEELTSLSARGGGRAGGGRRGGGGGGEESESESEPSSAPEPEPAQPAAQGESRPPATQPERPASESPAAGAPAQPSDPISGAWKAAFTGEVPPGMTGFDLTLQLREGAVSGEIRSQLGNSPLEGGRFDAASGSLTIDFQGPAGPATLSAKLQEGALTGTLASREGGVSIAFDAKRDAPTAATRTPGRRSGRGQRAQVPPGKPLSELVPTPYYVASIEASRYQAGRVYLALDGHRSDNNDPLLLASEDYGRTWRSITANLPAGASARVLREDIKNEDILYVGTETGCHISINRGKDWTRLNSNLPTVAVHEFAQHPTNGEIVAATHGRSLWAIDATPLRQMNQAALSAPVHLYKPAAVTMWRSEPQRGISGARVYKAQNPSGSAAILYSLATPAREVSLKVTTLDGTLIRSIANPPAEAGLHQIAWDLRRAGGRGQGGPGNAPQGTASPAGREAAGRDAGAPAPRDAATRDGPRQPGGPNAAGPGATAQGPSAPGAPPGGRFTGGGGGGGRGGFGRLPAGTYRIVLTVDGQDHIQDITIQGDPDFPDSIAAQDEEESEEEEEHARPAPVVH